MVQGMTVRRRAVGLGAVVAFLVTTRALWPDAESRTQLQYLLVATLGYGHLIGAALLVLWGEAVSRVQRGARVGSINCC